MDFLFIAVSLVYAYLLGSFPTAYIVGKARKGQDIRSVGTHNMGAMNVFYSVGIRWGALVLATDIMKGVVAVAIANALKVPEIVVYLSGAAAILGHSYPIFLKFRGGKGGATTLGVLCFVVPLAVPVYLVLFGIILFITRTPTISYSLAFAAFPVIAWFVYHQWHLVVFSVLLVFIPVARYIPRIIEMRSKAGSWRHVFRRQSLKDRF